LPLSHHKIDPILLESLKKIVSDAIHEDVGTGDVTSLTIIPEDLEFSGQIVSRDAILVAGLPFLGVTFEMFDQRINFISNCQEGAYLQEGSILGTLNGPARSLLTIERTALNLLQYLSGIATLTRTYVDKIKGTGSILLDTRKTIPGMRLLSKYATKMGGAQNHRFGLYDGILIKDNHIAVCGSLREAVTRAKNNRKSNMLIEVECDTLEQVKEALRAEVDIIMFDNMTLDMMCEAVRMVDHQVKTEASGGVTLETIRSIAETGVDYISVGRLTQSAPAVDIGLDWSFSP
jgi:nicotinate-nucleotide pyrophosphorylase (carboxylating)